MSKMPMFECCKKTSKALQFYLLLNSTPSILTALVLSHDAGPDFRIKVEVYSCGAEDSNFTNTPRKLAKKLKTSISKAAGRKISAALQEENPEACLLVSSVA